MTGPWALQFFQYQHKAGNSLGLGLRNVSARGEGRVFLALGFELVRILKRFKEFLAVLLAPAKQRWQSREFLAVKVERRKHPKAG